MQKKFHSLKVIFVNYKQHYSYENEFSSDFRSIEEFLFRIISVV